MDTNTSNLENAKVIAHQDNLVLVEWEQEGIPQRAWVMPAMIVSSDGHTAVVKNPKSGIPYGMEWRRMVDILPTPEQVEIELKKRGIWTMTDLRQRSAEIVAAIQSACSLSRAGILQAAERYERQLSKQGEQ